MSRASSEPPTASSESGRSWIHGIPFDQLPDLALPVLASAAEPVHYPKRGMLFREDESSEYLWVLQEGRVHLTVRPAESRVITLDVVTPWDGVFGLSAFSGGPYVATAVAATPVTALRIPAGGIRTLLQSHPRFSAAVTQLFNRRFHHIVAAYTIAFAPVDQRIASVLIRLEGEFGATLPLTRREIAELAGTTVETAIRVTNRWQREHLLRLHRGQVVLVNAKVIRARAQAA